MKENVTVTCPHCETSLVIDVEAGVVVDHTPRVRTHDTVDFDARLKEMEAEKARSSDRMAEAMRQENSKNRLMEDKFRSLMEKVKNEDDGSRPLRDIDLD